MQATVHVWHFFAVLSLMAAFGAALHVLRAVVNVLPDRLSDRPGLDLILSDGYNWADHVFGTEYDDAGYYRLDSLKNLRLSCAFTMISGAGAYLLMEGAAPATAALLDTAAAQFRELLVYRWQSLW